MHASFIAPPLDSHEAHDSHFDQLLAIGTRITETIDRDEQDSYFPEVSAFNLHAKESSRKILEVSALTPFPEEFRHVYYHATHRGLLDTINCVWAYSARCLALWNYESNVVTMYHGIELPVITLAVARSRCLFDSLESVDYLLVVATEIEINILGIHFEHGDPCRGGMHIFSTPYYLPLSAPIHSITVSKDGHIYLQGIDCEISELVYIPLQEGQLPACRQIFFDSFRFLKPALSFATRFLSIPVEQDPPLAFVVDNSRDLLYSLSKHGKLQVYSIDTSKSHSTLTYLSAADLGLHIKYKLKKQDVVIVGLHPLRDLDNGLEVGEFVVVCSDASRVFYKIMPGVPFDQAKQEIIVSHIHLEQNTCSAGLCSKNVYVYATQDRLEPSHTVLHANIAERNFSMSSVSDTTYSAFELKTTYVIPEVVQQISFKEWHHQIRKYDPPLLDEWYTTDRYLEHNPAAKYGTPGVVLVVLTPAGIFHLRQRSPPEEIWGFLIQKNSYDSESLEEFVNYYGVQQTLSFLLSGFQVSKDSLPYSATGLYPNIGDHLAHQFQQRIFQFKFEALEEKYNTDQHSLEDAMLLMVARMLRLYWNTQVFKMKEQSHSQLQISRSMTSSLTRDLQYLLGLVKQTIIENDFYVFIRRALELFSLLELMRELFTHLEPELSQAAVSLTLADLLVDRSGEAFIQSCMRELFSNRMLSTKLLDTLRVSSPSYCSLLMYNAFHAEILLQGERYLDAYQLLKAVCSLPEFEISKYCHFFRDRHCFQFSFSLAFERGYELSRGQASLATIETAFQEAVLSLEALFITSSKSEMNSDEADNQFEQISGAITHKQSMEDVFVGVLTDWALTSQKRVVDKLLTCDRMGKAIMKRVLQLLGKENVPYDQCVSCARFAQVYYQQDNPVKATQVLLDVSRKPALDGQIDARRRLVHDARDIYLGAKSAGMLDTSQATLDDWSQVLDAFASVIDLQYIIVYKLHAYPIAQFDARRFENELFEIKELLFAFEGVSEFADLLVAVYQMTPSLWERQHKGLTREKMKQSWTSAFSDKSSEQICQLFQIYANTTWKILPLDETARLELLDAVINAVGLRSEELMWLLQYLPLTFGYSEFINYLQRQYTKRNRDEYVLEYILAAIKKFASEVEVRIVDRDWKADWHGPIIRILQSHAVSFQTCRSARLTAEFMAIKARMEQLA